MFRATESGYSEFKFQLIRRAIKTLVETPDPVTADEFDEDQLLEAVGLDLSELYWDRIPESHYHFIATVAADNDFHVPENVRFDQPAEDVIEQIAFAAIIEDVRAALTGERDTGDPDIETVYRILDLHDRLDTLVDTEFATPSAAIDDFSTWAADNDVGVSFSRFSEQQIRRLEPLPLDTEILTPIEQWTTERLNR